MKTSLGLWAGVAVLTAFLALATLGLVSYRNTGELMATTQLVEHCHDVLERTDQVQMLLEDAEAEARGYLITGDRDRLAPYRTRLEQLDAVLDKLEQLTHDDPAEHRYVEDLEGPLAREREVMQELVRLGGDVRVDAARDRSLATRSNASRDEVHRVLEGLARAEREVLTNREHEAAATAHETRATILIGTGLLGLVLALAGVALYSEARGRRQGDERYSRLVELCPDAILIVRDGHVVFGNGAFWKLLDCAAEQLLGKSPLDVVHADSRDAVRERLREVQATGRAAAPREEKFVRCDGAFVDVEVSAAPFADRDGSAVQVVLHDVTERKRLEASFLRAQRLESIGTLAGGIAHDLNNILTPILMAAKLLGKDRPEAQRRELLATVQTSAERGAELVRHLLAFAGGVEGPREPLHLKPVIREVQKLLTATLPKSVLLRVEMAPDLGLVAGDQTRLAQVLMNLCVNARDAMPQGGKLVVSAANAVVTDEQAKLNADAHAGRHVLLTVTDSGGGIPHDIQDKIFDPFFTTKERGKGTGLGLSTVRGIVRSHGGFVDLYSEPGKGSRFAVYLPALEAGESEATPAPEGRRDLPAGRGELVLVIDDEEAILLTVKATLEANGYRALTAARGAEGVQAYRRSGEVRAVLLDMMMPGMDGPATMRKLLEIDPKARIIAASGLRATGRVAEAVAAGARTFLPKPYTEEQLLRALAEVLRGSGEHGAR